MIDSFQGRKRKLLEKRLDGLYEELDAVNSQFDRTLSETDRIRLQRQIQYLEYEIDKTEIQIKDQLVEGKYAKVPGERTTFESNSVDDIEGNKEVYDAFLSHSHVDAELVELIAKILEDEEGLRVWLDKWVLIPGEHWQQEMELGLSQAEACVIFIGGITPSGWFKQEIQRALNRQAHDPDFRVIPVLLKGANFDSVDSFLNLRTWVDFRQGITDQTALHRLVSGIKGVSPGRYS